jgi:hypothetical protein
LQGGGLFTAFFCARYLGSKPVTASAFSFSMNMSVLSLAKKIKDTPADRMLFF